MSLFRRGHNSFSVMVIYLQSVTSVYLFSPASVPHRTVFFPITIAWSGQRAGPLSTAMATVPSVAGARSGASRNAPNPQQPHAQLHQHSPLSHALAIPPLSSLSVSVSLSHHSLHVSPSSLCLSISVSLSFYLCLSFCLSISLCLSVPPCLSVSPCLCVSPCVCLSLSVCMSVCSSVSRTSVACMWLSKLPPSPHHMTASCNTSRK